MTTMGVGDHIVLGLLPSMGAVGQAMEALRAITVKTDGDPATIEDLLASLGATTDRQSP